MNFGEKLYYLLGKKNLTQADLARKINQKTSAIARWVTGKYKPSSKNMNRIAEALNVSIEELISDDKINKENDEIKEIKKEIAVMKSELKLLKQKLSKK
ncbi:MAG: helix-turn-helix domain-containing protein [Elusimicrobia bacterium]|nr:helix-turn-helix domain-containing protein [Elusimicrobiota bacterium]